jgi:N-dimethylarginine dimethylaminohydrolase
MRVLMCPPDHYGIEYEINPWMSRSRPVDPDAARRQWDALHDLLRRRLGLDVSLLDPVPGLPDLVFTANGGIARNGLFVPARFRHPERRGESGIHLRWFRNAGFDVRPLPESVHFEGEGDLLRMGDLWFLGHGFRTDFRAHVPIRRTLAERVVPVGLNDPRFYHLDTCFCPLGTDALLWYPPAFDSPSRSRIRARVARSIEAPAGDAMRFACNAVVSGKDVVVNSGCTATRRALEGAGFRVWETEMSEFIKAGGAAKCLVLFVPDPPPP